MNVLTKKQITSIKSLFTKHGRKKSSYCLVEGFRGCQEVIDRVPKLISYLVVKESLVSKVVSWSDFEIYVVSEHLFNELTQTVQAQGVMAIVKVPDENNLKLIEDDFILALDQISDPGNLGTILRTAKAANLHNVWLTKGSVDPYNEKVIRSAMAAQFLLDIRFFANLEELKQEAIAQGFKTFCLTKPLSGKSCFTTQKIYDKSVIVIGSEGHGVSFVDNAIDLKIPMPGDFESLNAAQAATILIFEYVRRKEENLAL